MMGDLNAMQPGLIDLLSVFFLKASSYEFMVQNSEYQDSYWYAFDYKTPQKSVFHMLLSMRNILFQSTELVLLLVMMFSIVLSFYGICYR